MGSPVTRVLLIEVPVTWYVASVYTGFNTLCSNILGINMWRFQSIVVPQMMRMTLYAGVVCCVIVFAHCKWYFGRFNDLKSQNCWSVRRIRHYAYQAWRYFKSLVHGKYGITHWTIGNMIILVHNFLTHALYLWNCSQVNATKQLISFQIMVWCQHAPSHYLS